jgi:antitoxin CptB
MSEPETASLNPRRRRLLYRATHRGTQENDILFGGFVQRHIGTFEEWELAAVEALLDVPDNELADWLTGRLPLPAEAPAMLRRIWEEVGSGGGSHPQPRPARGGGVPGR